ncbi:hypothetical protein N5K55_05855 [Pseudomonas aeruginosa]|nr:hypothetical protein [Pseudomonas aeruginosa]
MDKKAILDLIEQAKTADKDALVAMLKDLGLPIDNRKGEEKLRGEILAGLEAAFDSLPGGGAEAASAGVDSQAAPDIQPRSAGWRCRSHRKRS